MSASINAPLRLGIWGHGRMGQAIEAIARASGDDIVWIRTRENTDTFDPTRLREAEVVVEFTDPEGAAGHIRQCLEAGVPVISGTTGWLEQLPEMAQLAQHKGGALLHATNFSIGVHLFLAMLKEATRLMQGQPQYRAWIEETHHVHKKDAPSGTAITIAETMRANAGGKWRQWALGSDGELPADVLPVRSFREGDVPGTHEVHWDSGGDSITLCHAAHNREGFARGAWQAAHWIRGRRGVFTMNDMLNL
jgi:4-hydroxy-tetrahydrodipicolinate reductase